MFEQHHTESTLIRRLFLIGGGICLVGASAYLFLTDTHPLKQQAQPIDEDVQPQFQAEKLSAVSNLGVMVDEVRPLQQTTRVAASGVHDAEFRGSHFVQANLKNYSLAIFETNKEEIIRNFLAHRADRSKFIYLRLSVDQKPERYVLLYGVFAQETQAHLQLEQLDLKLPKSIHPQVVQFDDYAKFVNDLGAEELSNQQLYNVQLKAVAIPQVVIPVRPPSVSNTPENHALQTTITRRDSEGNVVSVTQSAGAEASSPR